MQPERYFSSKGVSAVRVVQIFSGSARLAGNVGCYQQSKRGSLTGGLKDILFHFVRISAGSQKQSNFCGAVLLTERTSWNFYIRAAPWSLSSSEDSGYSGSHLWGVEVDVIARSPHVPCLLLFYSVLSQYYINTNHLQNWINSCAEVGGWTWQTKKKMAMQLFGVSTACQLLVSCERMKRRCHQWDCSPFYQQQR